MKWSLPRIELCQRMANRSTLISLVTLTCTGFFLGCTAMPVMRSAPEVLAQTQSAPDEKLTPQEEARLAAMPAIPVFDGATESPRVATTNPAGVLVPAPKPFSWERTGRSTGNRPFLTTQIGDDGYRTLVVGSVGGNDPLALELVDQLARHLHEDSVILGGFESTVIRTLNPDGEFNHKVLNQNGQYINHGFPKMPEVQDVARPAEVLFLLNRLQDLQPQRVLHIRSIDGDNGLVAASSSCHAAAKEAAEWLSFKLVALPDKAVAGSLERYIGSKGSSDIITLAIPDRKSVV